MSHHILSIEHRKKNSITMRHRVYLYERRGFILQPTCYEHDLFSFLPFFRLLLKRRKFARIARGTLAWRARVHGAWPTRHATLRHVTRLKFHRACNYRASAALAIFLRAVGSPSLPLRRTCESTIDRRLCRRVYTRCDPAGSEYSEYTRRFVSARAYDLSSPVIATNRGGSNRRSHGQNMRRITSRHQLGHRPENRQPCYCVVFAS